MVSLALLVLAGIAKAVMDTLQFHYMTSIFARYNPLFWDPDMSWANKWKGGNSIKGEKFFLSSTLLVWTTDAWHLFQMIFLTLIIGAIVLYKPMVNIWADAVILKVAMTGTFELFFAKVFKK